MTTSISEWDLESSKKDPYKNFIEGIQNLQSKEDYVQKLEFFLDYADKDAEFLAEKGKEVIQDPDKKPALDNVLNKILSEMMVEHEYKITTMNYFQRVLRKFFKTNNINYDYKFRSNSDIREEKPELFRKKSAQPMTKEEFRALMDSFGNSRNMAMAYFSRDTGLRLEDCTALKVKYIEPILGEKPPNFYVFPELYYPLKNVSMSIQKQSDPLPATIIMGYESIRYVRQWMKQREKLLLENDVDPYDLEGFVFCQIQNTHDKRVGDLITVQTVSNGFSYHRDKLGLRKEVTFHSLRNNHTTDLISGGMPELSVLVLQGREGQVGSIRDYMNPDKEKLLTHYKKAYSSLALETKESEQIQSLELRLKELEREREESERKHEQEIERVKEEVMKEMHRLLTQKK